MQIIVLGNQLDKVSLLAVILCGVGVVCFVLAIANSNTFVIYEQACAPRFVWQTVDEDDEDLREPVGQCIIASSDFATKEKYTPCKTDKCKSLQQILHYLIHLLLSFIVFNIYIAPLYPQFSSKTRPTAWSSG